MSDGTVEEITNEDVIRLVAAGVSPFAIRTKIENSVPNFDVSVDALVELGQNGVSGDVIDAMIGESV